MDSYKFGVLVVLLLQCVSLCLCDDDWEENPALTYGLAFGITFIISVAVALCCRFCGFGKRRVRQQAVIFVSNAGPIGSNNGLTNPTYIESPAETLSAAPATYPPPYQHQYYPSAPPPYSPPQRTEDGQHNFTTQSNPQP